MRRSSSPVRLFLVAAAAAMVAVACGGSAPSATTTGAGISQFEAKTVDFGASDVPMGAADITKAGGDGALTQIPTTLGVVSIAFNISGVSSLNLDADTLSGIFLGHIKSWNDPAIAAL